MKLDVKTFPVSYIDGFCEGWRMHQSGYNKRAAFMEQSRKNKTGVADGWQARKTSTLLELVTKDKKRDEEEMNVFDPKNA